MNAWAVKGRDGKIIPYTLAVTEENSWGILMTEDAFGPSSIKAYKAEGFTCVPVQIIEAGEAQALERELAALKRGEFICQKCMLRKESENEKHEF